MRKIISYLMALVTSLTIAACMQPAGTQQQNSVAQQTNSSTQQTSSLFTTPDAPAQTVEADHVQQSADQPSQSDTNKSLKVKENGQYTDKERVALYIHTYGHLPDNFITKAEAQALGWDNTKGNLKKVAPGKSIGGDRFGNYEGQLPKASKRKYFECDIDYKSGKRNAKRIVFSSDGLIFYTDDHYQTFQQLY